MSKVHVSEIQGPLSELLTQLSGNRADEVLDDLKLMLKRVGQNLLHFVASVSLPAVDKFVASEAFGDKNSAGIKFRLGGNFVAYFTGKTEDNISVAELDINMLTKPSLDAPLLAKLKPELQETKLAHLYEMLRKQPQGQSGDLLVNGGINNFYVRDVKENLWPVVVSWDENHAKWFVVTRSLGSKHPLEAGSNVVSRKSAVKS